MHFIFLASLLNYFWCPYFFQIRNVLKWLKCAFLGNVGKTAFIFSMWFMYLFYQEMYTASLLVLHWYIFYSLFLLFFTFTSSMFIRSVVHHLQLDVTHNSNNSPFFHSLISFPWVKMYPSNELTDFPSFSLDISVQHVRRRSLFFVHHLSLYDYEFL